MTKENDNLFDDKNIAQSNWFKFQAVGDKVSGTLISKRRTEPQNNFGAQIVYELRTSEGNFINVAFAESKTGIHDRTKNIKFGQIVGFKFMEEIESKTRGFNPTKVINVYEGEMDPEYQAEQLGGKVVDGDDSEIAVEKVPF